MPDTLDGAGRVFSIQSCLTRSAHTSREHFYADARNTARLLQTGPDLSDLVVDGANSEDTPITGNELFRNISPEDDYYPDA